MAAISSDLDTMILIAASRGFSRSERVPIFLANHFRGKIYKLAGFFSFSYKLHDFRRPLFHNWKGNSQFPPVSLFFVFYRRVL